MNIHKCPSCAKEWPVNYCLECALLIGPEDNNRLPPEEDDIINDTFASCPAKIRLNPLRYLWFASETRALFKVWLLLAIACGPTVMMKGWSLLGILKPLFLPLSFLLGWIWLRMVPIYKNALLTPGMLVSLKPLEFISIANMDAGTGVIVYAVKRVAIRSLPSHAKEIGAQFPCVSYFQEGTTFRRWGNFYPQPLSFGTGDREVIQMRREKLGEEEFKILQIAFELGKYPQKASQLIWISAPETAKPPPLPKPDARAPKIIQTEERRIMAETELQHL
jgi:hypothetical protein